MIDVGKIVVGVFGTLTVLIAGGAMINGRLIQKKLLEDIRNEKIPSKSTKAKVKKIIKDGDVAVIVDLYDSKGFVTKKNEKIEGKKVSDKIKVGTVIKIKEE